LADNTAALNAVATALTRDVNKPKTETTGQGPVQQVPTAPTSAAAAGGWNPAEIPGTGGQPEPQTTGPEVRGEAIAGAVKTGLDGVAWNIKVDLESGSSSIDRV
jgi:hypothetical protein